jgi:hypothetical protein
MACLDNETLPVYTESKSQVVIEALVSNESSRQQVIVSRTNGGDSLQFIPVEGAEIIVSDNSGQYEQLTMEEPGYYFADGIEGIPGNTYYLNVWVNDTLYEAEETMPFSEEFDSVRFEKFEDHSFYDDGYYIFFYSLFENDYTTYYRATINKNDTLYNSYEDLLVFDNSYTTGFMELMVPYPFQEFDTVEIKSYAISENVYKYYLQVSNLTLYSISSIGSLLPNPKSNISNGALGYFQVSDVRTTRVVIE